MTIEELQAEVERLRQENEALKNQLFHKPNMTAYQKIAAAVSARVEELDPEAPRFAKQAMKRRLTDDLKWHLRVRYARDFSDAHVEPAMEFIRQWTDGSGNLETNKVTSAEAVNQ